MVLILTASQRAQPTTVVLPTTITCVWLTSTGIREKLGWLLDGNKLLLLTKCKMSPSLTSGICLLFIINTHYNL